MQIKQYVARDIQEALKKVKEEMGSEAIILSTKKTKGSLQGPGIYSPSMIEVVAAVDRPFQSSSGFSGWNSMAWPAGAQKGKEPGLPEEELFIQKILSAGLFPEFVQGLAEEIRSFEKKSSTKNLTEAYRGLLNWRLMESVEVPEPSFNAPRIWSFIGPTGIGKTTTLVKLAAHFRLKVTDRIALITTDTYRIGAVEQLKQYAQILRLPLETAYHPEELKQIIERNRDQDLLLIDTPGRSPQIPKSIEELRDFLTVHPNIENHLILSATTKDSDLEWIVDRFRLIPISSYIFTKIDETTHYVPLFNQLIRFKRPLSYLTKGQSVPEDIEPATKPRVAHMVLNAIAWN
ncbi:MAG: hypothetical protein FJ110_06385 [Deltaproteobacteria bacterium]|nr:hypothetical protein [Deltaproteobacteria bacterium]